MANREKKQLFTGARGRLLARGQRVGWATGCSGSRSYTKEPVEVLDNLEVEEHATTGYRVSLRMSIVGIVTKSLVDSGLLPNVGQSSQEHLKNAIALEPFTVQIEDNQTGKVQYEITDVEIDTENFDLRARSVMMTDVSAVGIRMMDSAET